MDYYMVFGLGFYTAAALLNWKMFKHAGPLSIVRGILLGLVAWPVGVVVFIAMNRAKNGN